MSFRKRNVGLSSGNTRGAAIAQEASSSSPQLTGVRPSPLDGRPTTSTGTATLDGLLAGHTGLPLGTMILVEENGTTDYAGTLLRYYAAEGLVQGHQIHVVGVPEQWGRELPGLVTSAEKDKETKKTQEKMKIAWRYEKLGQPEAGQLSRVYITNISLTPSLAEPTPDRGMGGEKDTQSGDARVTFCHSFDLTKRLEHPPDSVINFLRIETIAADKSPYASTLGHLKSLLASSSAHTVHRIVIPTLLSPALYPPQASSPTNVLPFLQGLRALLSKYFTRLTVMVTLPLSLYPRSSGLVRWMELLSDGVLELSPFPHSYHADAANTASSDMASPDEPPQGLLRIHRQPIFHERGVGVSGAGEDWAFTLSRRKFSIKPFSLPPLAGDSEAQQATGLESRGKKADMEF